MEYTRRPGFAGMDDDEHGGGADEAREAGGGGGGRRKEKDLGPNAALAKRMAEMKKKVSGNARASKPSIEGRGMVTYI